MKLNHLLKSIALLCVLPITSHAGWYNNHQQPDNADITVSIVSDSRGHLTKYNTPSGRQSERSYIEAEEGDAYKIKVRNNSDVRIGLVITVDGRNIISGKKSYLKSTERMYVLQPWKSAVYSGWRRNKNKVNRFFFTDSGDSYAEAWGDQSAMGVVAVAAFKEKHTPIRYEHHDDYNDTWRKGSPESSKTQRSKASNKRSFSTSSADKAGTGYGESKWSPTRKVSFKPKKKSFSRHFIKYEWHTSLCEKGVIDCYEQPRYEDNRFWHNDDYGYDRGGYAPPPRHIRKRMAR